MPKVLAILMDGFEEIELVTPVDLLRRAGVEVVLAALKPNLAVTGRSGLVLSADICLDCLQDQQFDCLFLPGGPGVKNLRIDLRITQLAREFYEKERWVAAICAAPLVLQDAKILSGKKFTAHFSVAAELPGIDKEMRVVIDGKIITSRGAGTALDFGLALVRVLTTPEKADEIHTCIGA